MVLLVIIECISIYLLILNNQSKQDQIVKSANALVQTNYLNTFNSFETLANTVFKGYIENEDVKNLFEKRDREGLYEYLKEDYSYLTSINFRQVHFHLPTNHSFLRMHKPNRFGDDLTHIRYTVAQTNKTKKMMTGLEMGRVVPGFRYVYPMFNHDNYLGSVETSFSVKAFVHKLEEVYDIHTHFLLKREVFNKKIFDTYRNYYETSVESDDYITLKRVSGRKSVDIEEYMRKKFRGELLDEIKAGMQTKETFGINMELKNPGIRHHHQVVTFLAVRNTQKQHIGYFVLYQDSEELLALEKELLNYIVIATIINLLFIFILYNEINRKEDLAKLVQIKTKELLTKTKELEELNNSLEQRVKEAVDKSKHQEKQLYEIEKMAQMGDMIGNIAHQWRQPLSAIATSASAIELQQELDMLDEKTIKEYMQAIVRNTKYLSETIDTFRDFIKSKKEYEEVDLNVVIKNVMEIVKASMKHNQIKMICMKSEEKLILETVPQELSQVLINIFNNAKDVIKERDIDNAWVNVRVEKVDNKAVISIEDNAGGISDEVLPKIFVPYFTTKHESIGTGLGLHMSQKIVHESLKGRLYVQNSTHGAQFFIELPL